MNTKQTLLIVGGLAILGTGAYFIYQATKPKADNLRDTDATSPTASRWNRPFNVIENIPAAELNLPNYSPSSANGKKPNVVMMGAPFMIGGNY